MNGYRFVALDVFAEHRFGGNPLAVFPEADGLSTADMQAIAREFNMSEVAFVERPADRRNTARVRIFTSAIEIQFAGHPNVGVGWLLASEGRDVDGVLRFEQGAGLVEVRIERQGGQVVSSRIGAPQPLREGVPPTRAEIAACAGLELDEIGEAALASVALNTVCVPVSAEALARARCRPEAFHDLAARRPDLAEICLLYLYDRDGAHVRARMFAPLSGTIEDPATGSAACALTALLLKRDGVDGLKLEITQGVEMGRPSRMLCEAVRRGDDVAAFVSGACVPVFRGELI
ncbi:MAG: PhzF family phenazine biosynthesis protein [Caulobacterales bacterium]